MISSFRLQVGGTQEGPIGTAESVLTEDGADVPASDNMVLRKLLVSANRKWLHLNTVCSYTSAFAPSDFSYLHT